MIDIRYKTFIELIKAGNYVGAAKSLNITQPAVSQHIKYLEEFYNAKLIVYKNKKLTLTPQGELLYRQYN